MKSEDVSDEDIEASLDSAGKIGLAIELANIRGILDVFSRNSTINFKTIAEINENLEIIGEALEELNGNLRSIDRTLERQNTIQQERNNRKVWGKH